MLEIQRTDIPTLPKMKHTQMSNSYRFVKKLCIGEEKIRKIMNETERN